MGIKEEYESFNISEALCINDHLEDYTISLSSCKEADTLEDMVKLLKENDRFNDMVADDYYDFALGLYHIAEPRDMCAYLFETGNEDEIKYVFEDAAMIFGDTFTYDAGKKYNDTGDESVFATLDTEDLKNAFRYTLFAFWLCDRVYDDVLALFAGKIYDTVKRS